MVKKNLLNARLHKLKVASVPHIPSPLICTIGCEYIAEDHGTRCFTNISASHPSAAALSHCSQLLHISVHRFIISVLKSKSECFRSVRGKPNLHSLLLHDFNFTCLAPKEFIQNTKCLLHITSASVYTGWCNFQGTCPLVTAEFTMFFMWFFQTSFSASGKATWLGGMQLLI